MKIKEICLDYLKSTALRYAMFLAVAGFVLMLGIAAMSSG
jgi:hypothetical protein